MGLIVAGGLFGCGAAFADWTDSGSTLSQGYNGSAGNGTLTAYGPITAQADADITRKTPGNMSYTWKVSGSWGYDGETAVPVKNETYGFAWAYGDGSIGDRALYASISDENVSPMGRGNYSC